MEDGEDLVNEREEEEEFEEEVTDLGEDQSDPFQSHLSRPSPWRLASISSASQGKSRDTKLPKSRLLGNGYLSIPGGSEQTAGGRMID